MGTQETNWAGKDSRNGQTHGMWPGPVLNKTTPRSTALGDDPMRSRVLFAPEQPDLANEGERTATQRLLQEAPRRPSCAKRSMSASFIGSRRSSVSMVPS
jgi:hypothetical protein